MEKRGGGGITEQVGREDEKKKGTKVHYLQAHYDGIQIQDGFPVLPQDIQTHVALKVDVRMVDLLFAFHLGRVVWEVLIDGKVEVEGSTFVHAFVRVDSQDEVENIVGVWK